MYGVNGVKKGTGTEPRRDVYLPLVTDAGDAQGGNESPEEDDAPEDNDHKLQGGEQVVLSVRSAWLVAARSYVQYLVPLELPLYLRFFAAKYAARVFFSFYIVHLSLFLLFLVSWFL